MLSTPLSLLAARVTAVTLRGTVPFRAAVALEDQLFVKLRLRLVPPRLVSLPTIHSSSLSDGRPTSCGELPDAARGCLPPPGVFSYLLPPLGIRRLPVRLPPPP